MTARPRDGRRLVATPPRGVADARSASSPSRSPCASSRPRSSASRSPRTRRTTSVSRATSSRAAGSCPTRCGATARRRSSFPRPAFEVWLPLPSLLAAIPIALFAGSAPISLDAAMRASQVIPVLAGSIVSVLAWRLAADVAAERGAARRPGRTLAIGTGLASAVYLPLLLHAALPDSTMLFGALVLGACLLMTRVLADPRGARWTRPRLDRGGPARRRRRAHPQRGRSGSPPSGPGSRGAGAARRARSGVRMIAVVAVVSLSCSRRGPSATGRCSATRSPARRSRTRCP